MDFSKTVNILQQKSETLGYCLKLNCMDAYLKQDNGAMKMSAIFLSYIRCNWKHIQRVPSYAIQIELSQTTIEVDAIVDCENSHMIEVGSVWI